MSRFIDISGQKFGRLVVKNVVEKKPTKWKCVCDCGSVVIVSAGNLKSGHTKSCGCLVIDTITKHGKHGTREYKCWDGMIQRCNNQKDARYKYYGGRGIKVCNRWLRFENFYEDMGDCPDGLTIERLNNNFGYNPENCCWETWEAQAKNKRPASCGPHKQFWFRAWNKNSMAQYLSNNQKKFAKVWGLSQSAISRCLLGAERQHKGWTFERLPI